MLFIKKSAPPVIFQNYTQQKNAHFDDMPTEVKQTLRESLVAEQGGICAYCMKRIFANKDEMKIEHLEPRAPENELDYHNLLAVCHGGEEGNKKHYTCDKKKGNQHLHLSPLRKADMATITYRAGKIYSSSEVYQHDLHDILNLNDENLIQKRNEALIAFQRALRRKCKNASASQAVLSRYYRKYRDHTKDDYKPYAGVIIFYLKRRQSSENDEK